MFWNRAMETIRGDELADLQIKRLKWSLDQAGKTGLYQRKDERGWRLAWRHKDA